MVTGLQTMPTIAWFPLAIMLFGLNETAILFVVVLGAGPAIANGVISGVDHIPPLQLRAGRVLGARGLTLYRHVIIPGSLPGYVAGLKQGWAFAWRSLLAGELLVIIAKKPSLGVRLELAHQLSIGLQTLGKRGRFRFVAVEHRPLLFELRECRPAQRRTSGGRCFWQVASFHGCVRGFVVHFRVKPCCALFLLARRGSGGHLGRGRR